MERNRIYISLSDESQEFQRCQASDAQRMGRDLNIEVEVSFAANAHATQEQYIKAVLERSADRQPTAIVVQPVVGDGEDLAALARDGAGKGIGWISLNRRAQYMEPMRREYPQLPIASVSSDQVEIGRLQGRQLLAFLKGRDGRVLYVQGPADTSAAQDRLKGTRDVLSTSRAKVDLEITNGDWGEASAERATAAALGPQPIWRSLFRRALRPDAIVCQNDQMAVGARRAARAAEVAAPIFGVDGLPEGGQRLVNDGELLATVIVVPNAGTAVHLVARHLWERLPIPPEILVSPLSYPNLVALAR